MITASLTSMFFLASLTDAERIHRLVDLNEMRYENIAVRLETQVDTNENLEQKSPALEFQKCSVWHVSLDGKYRTDLSSRTKIRSREEEESSFVSHAFDGEVTRYLFNKTDRSQQITQMRNRELVYPHSIMIRDFYRGRLGNYLRYPQSNTESKLEYRGIENVGDCRCCKLAVIEINEESGDVVRVNEFWLAPERNYVPLRVLTYDPEVSATIPIAEGVMSELTEMAPGVWFPARCSYTAFDHQAIRNQQPKTWRCKASYDVKGVSFSEELPSAMLDWKP